MADKLIKLALLGATLIAIAALATASSRTKHINLLTTASGPRGEAYLSVTGT